MTNTAKVVLCGTGIKKYLPVRGSVLNRVKRNVKAVNGIDTPLYEGEIYGLVGGAGCGKNTLGRTLAYLAEPTGGSIEVLGQDMTAMRRHRLIEIRHKTQMVFQDPCTSPDPRQKVDSILVEALKIHNIGTRESRVDTAVGIVERMGLRLEHFHRYPREFPDGQWQRAGLTRALVLNPKIIICDEPVSTLDISVQAQVIDLLQDLREKEQISFLLIVHNMSVVRRMSDRIGVICPGYMMKEVETEELFRDTLHPCTKALLSAAPNPSPHTKKERIVLEGDLPSPIDLPSGCMFHIRCPYVTEQYSVRMPRLKEVVPGHRVTCLMHEEG